MNREELRIYTGMTNPNAPEQIRVSKDGSKLYAIFFNSLWTFESPDNLYDMSRSEFHKFYLDMYNTRIRPLV